MDTSAFPGGILLSVFLCNPWFHPPDLTSPFYYLAKYEMSVRILRGLPITIYFSHMLKIPKDTNYLLIYLHIYLLACLLTAFFAITPAVIEKALESNNMEGCEAIF